MKHDLRDGRIETHDQGPARMFFEPVFVPRSDDAAEDDGWREAQQGAVAVGQGHGR